MHGRTTGRRAVGAGCTLPKLSLTLTASLLVVDHYARHFDFTLTEAERADLNREPQVTVTRGRRSGHGDANGSARAAR